MKIFKKWWFWVIVVFVVVVGIGGGASSSNDSGKSEPSQPVSQQETPAVSTEQVPTEQVPEVVEETPAVAEKTTYGVGETATAKSYTLTVESCKEVESDNQFNQPTEGNAFVQVVAVIENTSSSEMNVSSMLNFNAYVDGFSTNESLTADIADESVSTMNGTLGVGKKIRGKLCYEVPENWAELQIDVDLGFSSKDELTLLFKNN